MSDIWSFLTEPENRDALSWLGGGLVVVCGGLWAVLKFFINRRGGAGGTAGGPPPESRVSAGHGGIAGGRDVRIDNRSGLQGGPLVLLVLAILGAILIAVSQAGHRVAVSDGVGIGGDVRNSTITNQ